MSAVNSDSIRAGAAGVVTAAYIIENSLRCNLADSAAVYRTWSSTPTDADVCTGSIWVKRCNLGAAIGLLGTTAKDAHNSDFGWHSTDKLVLYADDASAAVSKTTIQVFRDPSAWVHLVMAVDYGGTGTDKGKIFVNGVRVTDLSPDNNSISSDGAFNRASTVHWAGRTIDGPNAYYDGYMAEFYWIDGQQLDADNFGEFDSKGNWVPKEYTGTYGDDGSYLDFAVAPGTGNGAGTDVSGNNNHWTDTGLAANDQTTDSPTDDAENDIGNYATVSRVDSYGTASLTDGGTTITQSAGAWGTHIATQGMTSGKWYWEYKMTLATYQDFGIINKDTLPSSIYVNSSYSLNSKVGTVVGIEGGNTVSINGASPTAYFDSTINATETIGFAFNADSGTLWMSENGVWVDGDGSESSGTVLAEIIASTTASSCVTGLTGTWHPAAALHTSNAVFYFRPALFEVAAPTGYLPLCTANLAAPAIKDPSKFYQTKIFTGTGSELAVTLTNGGGGAVKPDLVWIKDRDTSVEHVLTDSARGATKEQNSDAAIAETTVAQGLKSFDTSGFTLGTDSNYNASSSLNVAWCWNTQGGAGSSNEDGSINTTTTSVGTTQGMSISTYTGTGAAGTIGHGLGAVPEFILIKADTTEQWAVYHGSNTSAPETERLNLDDTGATSDSVNQWNDTAPTSTLITIGPGTETSVSGTGHLCYAWAGVEGFSKFDRYIGNGSTDGPVIWCGFRPALVMVKRSDSTSAWAVMDDKREGYNVDNDFLDWAAPDAEQTDDTTDLLSNGFKIRTTNSGWNATSGVYIFAAWAKNPFGGDGVSQARAR